MQYSPKLKMAMEEIAKILATYDIGASIIIHTPGHTEYLFRLNPSYSCAKVNGDEIRFTAKLEDFSGDKVKWAETVSNTANLMESLAMICGRQSIVLFELIDQLKAKVHIDNTPGDTTSHTQQNN